MVVTIANTTTHDHTCVMFNLLSAISPMIVLALEQAVPRIISLVGCDGSVCWVR